MSRPLRSMTAEQQPLIRYSPQRRRLARNLRQELPPRRSEGYDEYGLFQSQFPRAERVVTVLSEVKVGGSGVLESVDLPDEVSHHLAHLGFLPGATCEVLRRAPAGDPTVYRVDGVEVGLRRETASHILIELETHSLEDHRQGRP